MISAIEEDIIKFAIRNEEILALTRGNDPEEGNRAYYLLVGEVYNFCLADKSAEFELESIRNYRKGYVNLMEWPIGNSDYAFIGEEIWRRGKIHSLTDMI